MVQTILVILTMVGLFLDRPRISKLLGILITQYR